MVTACHHLSANASSCPPLFRQSVSPSVYFCISSNCWGFEWPYWRLVVRSSRSLGGYVHALPAAGPGPALKTQTHSRLRAVSHLATVLLPTDWAVFLPLFERPSRVKVSERHSAAGWFAAFHCKQAAKGINPAGFFALLHIFPGKCLTWKRLHPNRPPFPGREWIFMCTQHFQAV